MQIICDLFFNQAMASLPATPFNEGALVHTANLALLLSHSYRNRLLKIRFFLPAKNYQPENKEVIAL
jgi:hypothetical protein